MNIEKLVPIALTMHSGDRKNIVVTVRDEAGAIVDLTGSTARFRLARHPGAISIFEKAVGSGLSMTDPAAGVLTVTLSADDTVALVGVFHWDVVVIDASGNPTTVAYGTLDLLRSNQAAA